jgi:ABC-type transport system involved in cytochrome c biogenesis permease subunit
VVLGRRRVFGIAGLWISFFVAPTDAQQGEGYRIIFVHVPASWMSMFIYLVMAFWAGLGLALNTRVSGMMAQALAPTGALMAASCRCGPARCGASRCGAPGGCGTRG